LHSDLPFVLLSTSANISVSKAFSTKSNPEVNCEATCEGGWRSQNFIAAASFLQRRETFPSPCLFMKLAKAERKAQGGKT
jgi:hypothetical protein